MGGEGDGHPAGSIDLVASSGMSLFRWFIGGILHHFTPWYILDIYRGGGVFMDRAKLFQSGRSQAVRLPKEFRFSGTEVYVKRVGNAVVLLPMDDAWDSLAQSLDLFSNDYMIERDQPTEQQREEPF